MTRQPLALFILSLSSCSFSTDAPLPYSYEPEHITYSESNVLVRGHVSCDGEPCRNMILNVTVLLVPRDEEALFDNAQPEQAVEISFDYVHTDNDGSFSLFARPALRDAVQSIIVRHTSHPNRQSQATAAGADGIHLVTGELAGIAEVAHPVSTAPGVAELTLTRPPFLVAGTVADMDDRPVPRAVVVIDSGPFESVQYWTESDDLGRFEMRGFLCDPSAPFTVRALKRGLGNGSVSSTSNSRGVVIRLTDPSFP